MLENLGLLFIDWETYFNTKDNYSLKKMSMTEYVRSPLFKAHGLGYRTLEGSATWVSNKDIPDWAEGIDWSEVAVCAHNVKFDGSVLAWKYGVRPALYLDTLSMARAVIGSRTSGHSLAGLARYYDLTAKGELKTDGLLSLTPEQEAELASYCIGDVDLAADIFTRLAREFPTNQYTIVDWAVRCFIDPKMMLDTKKLEQAVVQERERRTKIFEEIGIEKKIFSSNKKFAGLLESKGFEVPKKISPRTQKEIPAFALGDPAFLEMWGSENETLANLCEARVAAKSNLLETRSEKLFNVGKTGLFPFDINFSGAKQTHRFSGGAGAGGNPQNLTRKGPLRESVCAPEGSSFVVADFAGIELRIVAWLAKEMKLISLITGGEDVYSDFAGQIYGHKITKENKDERQFGKVAVLGLGYNMGADKFQKQVKVQIDEEIDSKEAWRIVTLYRTYYSAVPRLWGILDKHIEYLAQKREARFYFAPFLKYEDGCVVLPSGLKLQYPNLRMVGDGQWVYTAHRSRRKQSEDVNIYGGKLLENISQALAGEICKTAIERLEADGIHVCGQIHDELHVIVPKKDAEFTAQRVLDVMSQSPSWWPDIRLSAEVGVGCNWAEAKAV